jgi:diketogulonate reductase-like aldo/keto reductase
MEYRSFGGSLERRVSVIGQGTWLMEKDDRRQAIAALRTGLDLGMNHVDTAEMYGSGRVEELVAEAIEGRRDEVFLVSKVLPENASRTGTLRACEQSLQRLRTDHLDCYLLHWRGPYPLEETFAAFEQLRAEGKIRSWGVSNFDQRELADALAVAGEPFACDQVLYHLQERAIEWGVVPWCQEHGVAVTAYSPFGHGDFPKPHSGPGRVLAQIAQAHGATPRQVALRFLLQHPLVLAIPKSSSAPHTRENAGAAELRLTEQDLALLDRTFPRGPQPRELPVY